MQHKAQRLFLYLLISTLAGFQVVAQNMTRSPYSIIGVGELQFQGTPQQSAMGQTGLGVRKQAEINILNPASLSSLRYTVIDGGMMFSEGELSQNGNKSEVDNFSFSYFMFAMPISVKRKIGVSFGLTPYSSKGYNVNVTRAYPDYIGVTNMIGTGGLSKFHLAVGGQLFKNLSIGANMSYIFGQLYSDQKLLIPVVYNKFNVAETRSQIVSGAQYQVGLQYHKDFEAGAHKDKYNFTLGATYTLDAAISGTEKYFIRTMGIGGTTGTVDTVAYNQSNIGNIDLPYSLGTGFSLSKKDKWMVAADVNYTNWSAYRSFGISDSLSNSLGFGVGGSFIPDAASKEYGKRIEYRLGGRYDNGNVIIKGHNIGMYAISGGIGLPIGKTKSRLNFTVEYVKKGTNQDYLIQEEYIRFIFGINFSDKWFQRTKYE